MFEKGIPGARWLRAVRSPLRAALGHLEREVMDVLWRHGELPVREVQARLERQVAYTTVMTTLDRLFKKGFVQRRRQGRAFLYTAALGREELEARVATGLIVSVFASSSPSARPLLSNLVDVVGDRDDRLLDELEELVRRKRARIGTRR